jgi:hypothetical protein
MRQATAKGDIFFLLAAVGAGFRLLAWAQNIEKFTAC